MSTTTLPIDAVRNHRIDRATGTKEEVEFFGPGPHQMFGCRYTPPGPALGGVVICSSVNCELLAVYRDEVLLARMLASRGVAVQRFHYRGAGHSYGETKDVTFETLRDDALIAAARLTEATGLERLAFMGVRFGGLVAGAAASAHPAAPLVLWEPVFAAASWFREGLRARLFADLKEGEAQAGSSTNDVVEQMRREGFIDVMGYPLDVALYESSIDRSLIDEVGGAPRPILVGQIGKTKRRRPEQERAIEVWRANGSLVDVRQIEEQEIPWFLPDARHQMQSRASMLQATSDWIVEALTGEPKR